MLLRCGPRPAGVRGPVSWSGESADLDDDVERERGGERDLRRLQELAREPAREGPEDEERGSWHPGSVRFERWFTGAKEESGRGSGSAAESPDQPKDGSMATISLSASRGPSASLTSTFK